MLKDFSSYESLPILINLLQKPIWTNIKKQYYFQKNRNEYIAIRLKNVIIAKFTNNYY